MANELSDEDLTRLAEGMEPIPVTETDFERAFEWLVSRMGSVDARVTSAARSTLEKIIAELKEGEESGDRLYLCRSRHLSVLAGHEGSGLVRNGALIRYKAIVDY